MKNPSDGLLSRVHFDRLSHVNPKLKKEMSRKTVSASSSPVPTLHDNSDLDNNEEIDLEFNPESHLQIPSYLANRHANKRKIKSPRTVDSFFVLIHKNIDSMKPSGQLPSGSSMSVPHGGQQMQSLSTSVPQSMQTTTAPNLPSSSSTSAGPSATTASGVPPSLAMQRLMNCSQPGMK